LLVGLFLLLGLFPREIVLVAWVPINLTLTIFNWVELVGHLPIYGMMAVLLLWTSDAENRGLWRRGLRDSLFPAADPAAAEPPAVLIAPDPASRDRAA
jgi:hypothetical protein